MAAVIAETEVPTERLEAEARSLASVLAATTCQFLLVIGELDRRESWKEWGCASMAQWLSWKCGLSIVSGRTHVRVARALEHLPEITRRFSAGELSYSKVRALTRIATPKTEEELVELALVTTAAQLDVIVRAYERTRVDASTAQAQHGRRNVLVYHEDDGMGTLVLRLPRDGMEVVLQALDRAVEEVPPDPDPTIGSAGSRRADGVLLLAETFLAGRADRPATEMVVHVEAADLRDPSPVVERLLCDCAVRVVADDDEPADAELTDAELTDVVVKRRTRTVPVALRRFLERRDGGCRWPGCHHSRFVHVHHVVHFTPDGPTTRENCIRLCGFHHRSVHEGGWRVVGDPAESFGLSFIGPDGRRIDERPEPSPPVAPTRIPHVATMPTADGARMSLGHALDGLHSLMHRRT